MILLLISALLCLSFVILTKVLLPKLSCISESYYKLSGKKQWLFPLWTIVTAFTLLPIWLEVTPEGFQFLAFLSAITLGCVGLAPHYLTHQKTQHYIFAAVCALLAILWGVLIGLWFVPAILIVLALAVSVKRFDLLFWLEAAAILSVYISILIRLLWT